MAISFSWIPPNKVDEITEYYKNNWQTPHIYFEGGSGYLKWAHLDKSRGRLNFFVARDSLGQIMAAVGVLDTSFFSSPQCESICPYWLILLSVDKMALPGMSVLLIRALLRECGNRPIGTVGATSNMLEIYELLGFSCGTLNHYAWLNPTILEMDNTQKETLKSITNIGVHKNSLPIKYNTNYIASKDKNELLSKWGDLIDGYKNFEYIDSWYLSHPYRDYECMLSLDMLGANIGCAIYRKVTVKSITLIRVVDIIGDINRVVMNLVAFCSKNQYTCFDLYSSMNIKGLQDVGVEMINSSQYFAHFLAPLESKEVPIRFAISKPVSSIGRGDCDQDRPSPKDLISWS